MKNRIFITIAVLTIWLTTLSCSMLAGQGTREPASPEIQPPSTVPNKQPVSETKGIQILSLGAWGTDDKDNKRLNYLLDELDLTLKYSSDIPESPKELLKFPIILFGTCTLYPADEIQLYKSLLTDYVSSGGSLIYTSGNACKFTGEDELSKSQMANVISEQWGMTFLGEDFFTEPEELFGNAHPLPVQHSIIGTEALYNTRYTTMNVIYPAKVLYETEEGPYLAVYEAEGNGTVIGVASEFFFSDNSDRVEGQKINDEANFVLMKSMFTWLIEQSSAKMQKH